MRYTDEFQANAAPLPPDGAPQAHVAQTSNSSGGATDWFLDSGATHHVTSDINNLSSFESYEGTDQLHIGDGKGLLITHVGSAIVYLGTKSIVLSNVLLVPGFTKNLISLSTILSDNQLTIAFHSCFCIIKDSLTSKILLQTRACNGLYLMTTTAHGLPQAFLGEKVAADLWHSRLGHPSFTVTRKIIVDNNLPCNKSEFHMCTACNLAKSHKLPFTCSNTVSYAPLELIHADVWGPAPVVTTNGFRYYLVFVDDFTKFVWIFFLHSKDEVLQVFTTFKLQVENLLSSSIKILCTDGGTEFKPIAKRFPQLVHQVTCPYTPEQNGVAERKHRHIVELSLAAISHASLPLRLWDEVFSSTVYLINRLPPANFSTLSPFELLFNRPPDYLSLRVLGSQCFPYTRPYNQHKLQPRSLVCVFIGYAMSHKGYMCLHIPSGRIFVSRHVIFNEQVFPFHSESISTPSAASTECHTTLWAPMLNFRCSGPPDSSAASRPSSGPIDLSAQSNSCVDRPFSSSAAQPPQRYPDSNSAARESDQALASTAPSTSVPPPTPIHSTSVPPTSSTAPLAITSSHSMVTRSKDNTRRSKKFSDFVAYVATTPADSDPFTFAQASKVPHWQEAMKKEFQALLDNNTWILVPPPANQNVVGCKWIFKTKRHADGTVERYKARLVAKGFTQEEGVDYFDTFSPVVRPTTIRIVLSIAVSNHWVIRQLDVNNAFLHGELHETVYMHQPPGFVSNSSPSHVCLLKKALYGLKQSPRAWFHTLSAVLLELGFHGSKFDPSLFIAHQNSQTTIVLVYVDDIIITGSSSSRVTALIATLQQRFALKDLGDLHFFLGIAVHYTKAGVLLSQKQYILDLLCRTHMANAQPMSTPMAVNSSISKFDGEPFHDPKLYRAVVGALQYITITRPDITFPVNKCSQFMHSPTTVHWSSVKRILRYLKGSADHGLLLKPSASPLLHAYTDSDWAGCPDDRRSTSAFCIYLGYNLISWSSKKQPTVSKSSTEAEYRSLALAGAELIWVQYILQELLVKMPQPPVLWCDNIGATYLASNPMFHARTKHVEIDFHFIRERVVNKELVVKFISSKDQIADGLTKGLTVNRFLDIRAKLMVYCEPSA
ncbi:Gag/pol [Rhynchospora pubera]|uniref:Gag/pol n=1 Tax=Rhynchospora pubera TaxID=906938 RepID=A0AAV8GNW0_9POAL|nr:Gag/pol [Rhynchospora pubera]